MKELKKEEKRGLRDPDRDDLFELFITTTNIRWTYYKDTDKILGQTFGACVLQDFEAMTPNVLARTIETVEGGGMVILLKHGEEFETVILSINGRIQNLEHHLTIMWYLVSTRDSFYLKSM